MEKQVQSPDLSQSTATGNVEQNVAKKLNSKQEARFKTFMAEIEKTINQGAVNKETGAYNCSECFKEKCLFHLPIILEKFENYIHATSKETFYVDDPEEFTSIACLEDKYDFIVDHAFWVRAWADFLMKKLVIENG